MFGAGMWTGHGNIGSTNGVSWIPHWWIMRSWDVGAVVCCVWLESSTATSSNTVIDLVFDTLSRRTGQLTGSWSALLCCQRGPHYTGASYTHTSWGNKPHMQPWLLWQGQNQKSSISLPHLHDLNHIWKSLESFHLFIWQQMNALWINKTSSLFRWFCNCISHASFMYKTQCNILNICFITKVETTLWFVGHCECVVQSSQASGVFVGVVILCAVC